MDPKNEIYLEYKYEHLLVQLIIAIDFMDNSTEKKESSRFAAEPMLRN